MPTITILKGRSRPIPDVPRSLTLPSDPAIRLAGGIRAKSGVQTLEGKTMNWTKASAAAEILSSVAILATLVYLAIEIQQSAEAKSRVP